ncbi:hypothetical protein ACFW2I_36040 [Streptomyces nigra]|uniref:hypothetical protein n=1 Tax=Streptomyces nigra TaxID=1827580 RepID=UPI0036A6B47F
MAVEVLIGAAGVIVGALVTYLGPLRLQRKQAAHELEVQRIQLEHDKDLQLTQLEHDTQRQTADSVRDQIVDILAVRLIGRKWFNYLAQTFELLESGETVDPEAFRERSGRMSEETLESANRLLAHGILLRSGGSEVSVRSPTEPNFIRCMHALEKEVYAAVRNRQIDRNYEIADEAHDVMHEAIQARSSLLESLIRIIQDTSGNDLVRLQ